MEATLSTPPAPSPRDIEALDELVDHRVVLHGVSWPQFEAFLRIRGERACVRITYLEGELELMSPSWNHEGIKKCLARLLEAFAEERLLPLNGFGAWTLKRRARDSAIEPDECYCLGPRRRVPDLAIEVIWTHPAIEKLEVYRRLGVREVWLWEAGALAVHVLGPKGYAQGERSALLPDIDLALLTRFVNAEDQTAAVRAYRAALRAVTP